MEFTPHEFAELYKEIYKDLYRYALYSLGDAEDAKDAVSDAVLDGFRQRGTLQSRDHFRQWMFAILANKCRRKKREYVDRRANEQMKSEEPEDAEAWNVPDEKAPDVSRNLWIRQLFFSLEEEERQILSLHLFAGYTSEEIGRLLGMKAATVRSKEHRALQKLRKEVEKS